MMRLNSHNPAAMSAYNWKKPPAPARVLTYKYRNTSLFVLEMIMLVDMWLLIRTQRLLKKLLRLMAPVFKVLMYMILGAVLIVVYAFAHARLEVRPESGKFCDKPDAGKYLEIEHDSKFDAAALQKELVKMKSETMSLEKTLYRMNAHLKSLYERQRIDVNLADFASEAVGGLVIDTPDTQTYFAPSSNKLTIFGVPIWRSNHYSPRKVIQPWIEPGECWALRGTHGKVEIELAYSAFVESFTLEHIPASASLTGEINEAPRNFNVLGKLDQEYVMIGTFMYKNNGSPSQIFQINKSNFKMPFKRIVLEILSNWGNPDYTCIYRFKVHGKMYVSSKVNINNHQTTDNE